MPNTTIIEAVNLDNLNIYCPPKSLDPCCPFYSLLHPPGTTPHLCHLKPAILNHITINIPKRDGISSRKTPTGFLKFLFFAIFPDFLYSICPNYSYFPRPSFRSKYRIYYLHCSFTALTPSPFPQNTFSLPFSPITFTILSFEKEACSLTISTKKEEK